MSSIFALVAFALTATHCSGSPDGNPAAQEELVTILDDLDSKVFTGSRAHQGSYAPCLQDAYNGQFVHDWAQDKGQVSATYSFDPPKNGCYLVEEHHPGRDMACSRYLPKAAKLQVGYCYGKTADVSIDQSRNGGKWNAIGKWPFFVGHKGFFKMSNSPNDSCPLTDLDNRASCFWVADAFRVTYIGRTCSSAQEESTSDQVKADTVEDGAQEQANPGDMASPVTQGTISMTVTASIGEPSDLKLKMESLGVIEMALQAHFGYKSVNVLTLDVTSGARRLAELNQAPNYRIDAVFEGHGKAQGNSNDQTLMDQVQALLDTKEAGILVKSVDVSFESPKTGKTDTEPKEPTREYDMMAVGLGLVAGVLFLGCGSIALACRVLRTMKSSKTTEDTVTESDISMYPEYAKDPEKAIDSKEPKKEEDLEVISVSTAPPTDTGSDGCSDTGSANQ